MTYFPDLSRYTYFESDVPMVNVGWLDPPHSFPRGSVPDGFVDALKRMGEDAQNVARGLHFCGFCRGETEEVPSRYSRTGYFFMGTGEIHVEHYSAPTLLVHYVLAHDYLPPAEFVDAVMRDQERWQATYFEKAEEFLRARGWTPDRRVDTARWRTMYPDLDWHPAAEELLAEFGGLDSCVVSPEGCVGAAARFFEVSCETGKSLYPIGVRDEFCVGVDPDGEVHLVDGACLRSFGGGRLGVYRLVLGDAPELPVGRRRS